MEKIKFIDEYYYQKENLPENFFEKIVELENMHYRNKFFKGFTDLTVIEELASTYKQAVEHFCQIDKEKENYFYEKMQNLLSNDKVIKLMDNSNDNISKGNNTTHVIFNISSGQENEVHKKINNDHYYKNNNNNIEINSEKGIDLTDRSIKNSSKVNHRKISTESFVSKFDKDYSDTKKRRRFSMLFKLVMNKMKFNSQITNTEEMQNKTLENLNNGICILNGDMEDQDKSFKMRLENAKKEKKLLNLANNSTLGNSFENGLQQLNESLSNSHNNNSNNTQRKASDLSLKNSNKENTKLKNRKSLKKHENNYNNNSNDELSFINGNLNLSFLSRRKKSINHIIDNFLKEFLHVYLDKTSNGVIRNVLKNFEEIYNEKKKYFVQYEEELAIFYQMTDENGGKKEAKDIDESIKLLMQSLVMERNEKLQMQDKLLSKIIYEIKNKGKIVDLNNDEDFNFIVNSVCEKIMSIFI